MSAGEERDKTKIAVELFDRSAHDYAAREMDIPHYHATFDQFCSVLPLDATVLELACGPGNITRYLLSIRPDLNILATDLAPTMLEIAKQHNPNIEVQKLDARDINSLDQTFNGLMVGFCLPYLSKEDALQLIADAAGKIRPGGVIYLSTMEGDYAQSDWKGPSSGGPDKIFMHYHEAEYLTTALKQHGFEWIEVIRQQDERQLSAVVIDLIILARRSVR